MSSPPPSAPADQVTVLIFKDNDASRTFQIPLAWISWLGGWLVMTSVVTLISLFFAIKFYRTSRHADPSRVLDLEQEIGQLKNARQALQAKLAAIPVTPTPVAPAVPIVAPASPTVAPPAASTPPAESTLASVGGVPLFTALPHNFKDLSGNANRLPISVSPAKLIWAGKNLRIQFNLQYVATDGGSQQGRLVIFARGPESLLAYPEGVLSRAGTESLIVPQKGEYFSVSRFREARAEFGPLKGRSQISDVEILILGLDERLLYYQHIEVPVVRAAAPSVPKPAVTSPSPTTSSPPTTSAPTTSAPAHSELIEPGVDP